jgi:hypothetical protein
MKLIVAVLAAAVGLLLLFVSGVALWFIFSQIMDGTDKEGTNIYLTPLYLIIGAAGLLLFIPIYRLARRGVR